MTGSLQVKGGAYYAVLNFKNENGKRRQKWIHTGLPAKGNKREANAVLNKLLAEFEGREAILSKDIMFLDFMYTWLDTINVAKAIDPNTHESYLDSINRYVKPFFINRKIKLPEIKAFLIQNFYNSLLANGLSGNTVLKVHANVHTALQHAFNLELVPCNQADKVKLPKKEEFVGNFYTVDEVNQLLRIFKDEAMYLTVLLTVFYGFRRSEVLGLKWKNFDMVGNTLTVQGVRVRSGKINSLEKPRTKNKTSHRTLPLVPEVKEVLLSIMELQQEDKALLGSAYNESEYVCKWPDGRPFLPNYISTRFRKVVSKSNLPVYRFHDLRHSAASMLLKKGFSLKDIQVWLGHSSIATTSRYAHIDSQDKEEMAATLGKIVLF